MKLSKMAAIAAMTLMSLTSLRASLISNFWTQLKDDSYARDGKQIELTYTYDFLEGKAELAKKILVNTPVLAYKFVSLEPAFMFTGDASNTKGEIAILLPINTQEIPIWGGLKVKDLYPSWMKDLANISGGLYVGENVTSGGMMLGFKLGAKFGGPDTALSSPVPQTAVVTPTSVTPDTVVTPVEGTAAEPAAQ